MTRLLLVLHTQWHTLLLVCGFVLTGIAPTAAFEKENKPDSAVVVDLNALYAQVLANHPIARQAFLLPESARQELRLARGAFDPKLASTFNSKTFKSKNYYERWNTELKIPVWIGTDLKMGYEQNRGVNLNPESDTDSGNGLVFAGISVPLGQGMFTDARRATLRQAQILQDMAEAERIKEINKLVLQVAKDYWFWYFAYHQYKLALEGYNLAVFRYNAVVIRATQGDLASIDTVEAKITIQEREISLRQAEVELANARLDLSNHLWGPEGEALELNATAVPGEFRPFEADLTTLNELLEYAKVNHPELLKVQYKLDQLNIERRLAREMLKPLVNLNYNFLNQPTAGVDEFNQALFTQNYKFGLEFAIPIFLRKERAKLQLTNLKIDMTTLERSQLNLNILNEVEANFNNLQTLKSMLSVQQVMVDNYRRLLAGELQKFQAGESSIFLVNVREGKLLETQTKLYDMQHKFAKSYAELRWAAGLGVE